MKKLVLFLLFMTVTTFATAQNFRFDEMTYSPEKTTFKLFAPADAKSVKVRIYRGGLGGKALKTIKKASSMAKYNIAVNELFYSLEDDLSDNDEQ